MIGRRVRYAVVSVVVLGPLADALVAPDAKTAIETAAGSAGQTTVLYPSMAGDASAASLLHHVSVDAGYEAIARGLLGGVVVGRDVTLEGVYHVPGMVRAGADGRVAIAERRSHLRARIAELRPVADTLDDAALRAHGLDSKLSELRARAAEAERTASERLSELEAAASSAEERSAATEQEYQSQSDALREQRVAVNQVEAERLRWRDRIDDLGRRLNTVRQDVVALTHAAEDRSHRLAAADAAADAAAESLPALDSAVAAARASLAEVETESPEEEAEMAEGARRLVALEEARIDARLKSSTLVGNLDLINREVELLTARIVGFSIGHIRLRLDQIGARLI